MPKYNDISTAPKNGTIVQLLVVFDTNDVEDEAGPHWTIGCNCEDNTGDSRWYIAGWCWTHDVFSGAEGTPIGWLPLGPVGGDDAKV